jgi:hypothetical protein
VLEHLLGDRETVPPAEGVFLERTWRMHPDVCRFVSDAMYEGRLQAVEGAERQSVASSGLSGAGVRLLEVEHTENRQSAPEEADRIAEEVEKLLDGGRYTDISAPSASSRSTTSSCDAVQRAGTPPADAAAARRPDRQPSTSSRARRRRSCSSR